MYDLELDRVVEEIKNRGAEKVLLQLPDGMRPFAYQLVEALEKTTGATVYLSGGLMLRCMRYRVNSGGAAWN